MYKFIFLLFTIVACGTEQSNSDINEGKLKVYKKGNETLSQVDYSIIFENNTVDETPIELIELGDLQVPSGQIVVCDPLVNPDMPALSRKVTSGKYPVKIYEAKTENSGDRCAIAQLEFTTKKAVKWVLATREGENINDLDGNGDFYGFSVDAGLGGFYDKETGIKYVEFMNQFETNNPERNIYKDIFAAEFKKNGKNPDDPKDYGDWINFQLPNSNLNITMFRSGYGDGVYPAFWGIDENGEVTSLVIDFLVLKLVRDEK